MVDKVTKDIIDRASRVIFRPLVSNAEPLPPSGEIKVGDAVKTLHLSKAVYGRVQETPTHTRRKGYWYIKGRTQPGAQTQRVAVHKENLDLIPEGELAPEDRL
jgi:hypothetical protein